METRLYPACLLSLQCHLGSGRGRCHGVVTRVLPLYYYLFIAAIIFYISQRRVYSFQNKCDKEYKQIYIVCLLQQMILDMFKICVQNIIILNTIQSQGIHIICFETLRVWLQLRTCVCSANVCTHTDAHIIFRLFC